MIYLIFLIVVYWLKYCSIKEIQPLIETMLSIFKDDILNELLGLLKFWWA